MGAKSDTLNSSLSTLLFAVHMTDANAVCGTICNQGVSCLHCVVKNWAEGTSFNDKASNLAKYFIFRHDKASNLAKYFIFRQWNYIVGQGNEKEKRRSQVSFVSGDWSLGKAV